MPIYEFDVAVSKCPISVSLKDLGMTRDSPTSHVLSNNIKKRIKSSGYAPQTPIKIADDLQIWVDNCSELISPQAVSNVSQYYKIGVRRKPIKGKGTLNMLRYYGRREITPQATDVGAVGEGVAFAYLTSENLTYETRPFDVNPDFIFSDTDGKMHLVQVKTSLDKKTPNFKEVIDLLRVLALTKHIRNGEYVADFIWVQIANLGVDKGDFVLKHLEVSERKVVGP